MISFQFLMRSILILVLLVQVVGFTNLRAHDRIPYISPGIKIGWDSNRGFTMGPKLGIGLSDTDDDKFLNLTVGIKSFQISGSGNSQFFFLDVQIGSYSVTESVIAFGGGVGLLFGREEGEFTVSPRTTVFLGLIVFPTLDFNFWLDDQISYEPGFELVLPIPLKKVDWGLE